MVIPRQVLLMCFSIQLVLIGNKGLSYGHKMPGITKILVSLFLFLEIIFLRAQNMILN